MNVMVESRMRRLKRLFFEEHNEKKLLNRSEYKIYSTLLTGYEPSDLEVEMIFREKAALPVEDLDAIVGSKIESKAEAYILEIFRAFDATYKGCINSNDLLKAFNRCKLNYSWQVLQDSFLALSPEDNLYHQTFRMLFMLYVFE